MILDDLRDSDKILWQLRLADLKKEHDRVFGGEHANGTIERGGDEKMTDTGKQLIDLLTQEGKKYGKYWIAKDGYNADRKAWYLDGFLAALKVVREYFDEEKEGDKDDV